MMGWFERQRLVKRGLACDKQRRRPSDSSWLERIDRSEGVRLTLLAGFVVSLYAISLWNTHLETYELPLLTFIMFICSIMYVQMELPELWRRNSRLFLLFGSVWVNLILIKSLFVWAVGGPLPMHQLYFLAPMALAPFIISLLLGPRAGLFSVLALSLLAALVLNRDFSVLFVGLITGFTAVYCTRGARKRADLIKAGIAVGVASLVVAVAFGLVARADLYGLGQQVVIGIFVGLATALVVSAVLPIFENIFSIITDISWIEMADLNHPLLQQMTIEAPGTYHHSLMVANLAEAAAKTLGLNGTQLRVMAYFHDIGKIIKPEYFAENIPPGENPHENLSPSMSALIIVAHVKEGVDLAMKFGLKRPVIDAIQQHHGDSIVYYFYRRAVQQVEDARTGGKIMNMREDDIPEVDESSFRYPGPRPQSRELGILALADSIEAASRSLDKPTPAKIESFVGDLVDQKVADGLLDESHLTLNEIRTAADVFSFTLKSMLHSRISYPKENREKSSAGEGRHRPPSDHASKTSSVRPPKEDSASAAAPRASA
jgi:hypothetical protein